MKFIILQRKVMLVFLLNWQSIQRKRLNWHFRDFEAIRIIDKKRKIKFYQALHQKYLETVQISRIMKKVDLNLFHLMELKLYSYWTTKIIEMLTQFLLLMVFCSIMNPRRGENFISRKTILGLIKVLRGEQKCLYLGNLNSKRDWGHAKEFVEAQWKILQQRNPDDFVIATGKNYSFKDLVNLVLKKLKIKFKWKKSKDGLEYAIAIENISNIKKSQIIVKQEKIYFRPNEVHNLVGDLEKLKKYSIGNH